MNLKVHHTLNRNRGHVNRAVFIQMRLSVMLGGISLFNEDILF